MIVQNDMVNKTDPDKDNDVDSPRAPQRTTNLAALVAQVDAFNIVHDPARQLLPFPYMSGIYKP